MVVTTIVNCTYFVRPVNAGTKNAAKAAPEKEEVRNWLDILVPCAGNAVARA